MRLAATEYDRFLDMLRSLSPEDWTRPTDCPAWDVRQMAAHCLGMAELAASPEESARQNEAAHRRGGVFIDALTGLQVEERRDMTPDELIRRYAEVGPLAAQSRRGTPAEVLATTFPRVQIVNDQQEHWVLGFLVDTILTRDTWMHRIDIARATRRDLALTPDHDGVIVADVVTEWAGRHGAGCTLSLTGPAGGHWTFGTGGPAIELDAVEFCRMLSPVARPPPGCSTSRSHSRRQEAGDDHTDSGGTGRCCAVGVDSGTWRDASAGQRLLRAGTGAGAGRHRAIAARCAVPGCPLPDTVDLGASAEDLPAEDYTAGVAVFASALSPWMHDIATDRWHAALSDLRKREVTTLLSTHGLPIRERLDPLLDAAAGLPTGPAFVPPAQEFVESVLAISH